MSLSTSQMEEFNQILQDFSSKKYRSFSGQLEETVMHFVTLSSSSLAYRQMREVLVNYKIICQNTNIESIQKCFEFVIQVCQKDHLSKLANVSLSLDDLDIPFPQVSSSSLVNQNHSTDTANTIKRLRFVWESYKFMLDILKNNNKFEDLFTKVSCALFDFCLQFDRKVEFKRLGDFLHSSLNSMLKSSNPHPTTSGKISYFSINLAEIESSTYQIQIRMAQLKTSIQLECWVDSFKVLDNLQSLFVVCKKSLSPSILLDYFQMAFTVLSNCTESQYQLLACASLLKCLGIVMKNGLWQETDFKLSHLCNQILLSFLAIPIYSNEEENGNEEDERLVRIAQYLGLSSVPTRQAIQRDILLMKGNVIFKFAAPSLVEYFNSFEQQQQDNDSSFLSQFISTNNCSKKLLSYIGENINILKLKNLLITSQSKVFDLANMVQLFSSFKNNPIELERFLVSNSKMMFNISVTIDHSIGKVYLQNDLSLFLFSNCLMYPVTSEDIQSPSNGKVQSTFVSCNSLEITNPIVYEEERLDFCSRCKVIEERKEKREQMEFQREQEQSRLISERLAQEQEQEKLRLAEESRKRETERLRKERESIEKEELKKLVDEFSKKCENSGKKFVVPPGECETRKDFFQLQLKFLQSDKEDFDKVVGEAVKEINFTERAIREAEISKLTQVKDETANTRKSTYESVKGTILNESKAKFEKQRINKERIQCSLDQFVQFKQQIMQSRIETHQSVKEENEKKFEAEKQARIEEFKRKEEENERLKAENKASFRSLRESADRTESLVIDSPFMNLQLGPIDQPKLEKSGSQITSPFVNSATATGEKGKKFDSEIVFSRDSMKQSEVDAAPEKVGKYIPGSLRRQQEQKSSEQSPVSPTVEAIPKQQLASKPESELPKDSSKIEQPQQQEEEIQKTKPISPANITSQPSSEQQPKITKPAETNGAHANEQKASTKSSYVPPHKRNK